MSKKITQQVWELAQPVVESFGLRLWDVEYVREGADWFLRLYIDKDGPGGGSAAGRKGPHPRQLHL